jgi:hypothetical protein
VLTDVTSGGEFTVAAEAEPLSIVMLFRVRAPVAAGADTAMVRFGCGTVSDRAIVVG